VSENVRFFFVFVSVLLTSRPNLEVPGTRNLRYAGIKYSLISLLLGPWALPWGPLVTLWSIGVNLSGGKRQTVASEVMRLKWGWHAPPNLGGNEKDVIKLTPRAAAEIDRRKTAGRFTNDVGVRILLAESYGSACKVEFDFPASDGRDWIGIAEGHTVLVDKEDAELLQGKIIDFMDGEFEFDAPLG
jgi:Fe-S cluster assembly iron-binding protein IscA